MIPYWWLHYGMILVPMTLLAANVLRRPKEQFPTARRVGLALLAALIVAYWPVRQASVSLPLHAGVAWLAFLVYLVGVRAKHGPARPGGLVARYGPEAWLRPVVGPARRGFDRLPLFWKMMTSLLALLVAMSVAGTLLVARNISAQATDALAADLVRRIGTVEEVFGELDSSAQEAAAAARTNEALATAVARRDRNAAGRILFELIANREDIEFIGAADTSGRVIAKLSRRGVGRRADPIDDPLGREAIEKPSDSFTVGRSPFLANALVVRGSLAHRGRGVGVVVTAVSFRSAVEKAAERVSAGVAYYDENGRVVASSAHFVVVPPAKRPVALPRSRNCSDDPRDDLLTCQEIQQLANPPPVRTGTIPEGDVYTAVRLWHEQGLTGPADSIGVSVLSPPVIAAATGVRLRLFGLLAATTLGLLLLGAAMSQLILRQVRPLVGAARRLQAGDLSARAPVLSGDEHGELARTFNAMVEALGERDEQLRRAALEKSDFFAHASHELRTPLFVIQGHAEMLLDSAFQPSERPWREEFGATIQESSKQMLGLVNDILNLTQLEAGGLELDVQDLDVADEVRQMLPGFEALARGTEVALEVDVPERLPAVRADRTRLREIVQNLVSNALKYTPDGGRVSLRAAEAGERLAIVVADTGVGIPGEAQPRIFEPFFRVKGVEARGKLASSGLGLSITKRLVEAVGGEISFTSTPGVGTTFTVMLPTIAGSDSAERRSNEPASATVTGEPFAEPDRQSSKTEVSPVSPD